MEIKKLFTLLAAAICLLSGLSCSSRPRLIEEEELKVIIGEMMITDAIIATKNENAIYDTLDTYATILQRHGYAREDFSYTVGEMAGRKSNPLNNIFEQIKAQLTGEATSADANFAELRSFDSLARATFSDTIYRSDRKLRPPFTGQEILIDSILKEGEYTVTFDYKTHASYDLGVRLLTLTTMNADTTKNIKTSAMLNRTGLYAPLTQKIKVPSEGDFRGLRVTFSDPKAEKGFKGPDTTVVQNVRLVYDPPIYKARKLLINKALRLNFDEIPNQTQYGDEQFWHIWRPQDSLAVDTVAGGKVGAGGSGNLRP